MRLSNTALNIEYSLVQAFFWMGFCISFSFAAFYLQSRGYSNSELGLVLSLGNVGGLVVSPVLASVIDRSKKSALFVSLWSIIALQYLLLIVQLLLPGKGPLISLTYCLYLSSTIVMNPIETQLAFIMSSWGGKVSYSSARGIGSLAYALSSMFIGSLVAVRSAAVLPSAALVFLTAQTCVLIYIRFQYSRCAPEAESSFAGPDGGTHESRSLRQFFLTNKRFCLMLLGLALMFFAHNLVTGFMINIVRNLGGDSSDMGRVNGVMAMMEIPVMLLYGRLTMRVKCSSTIRFAAVMFVFRALSIALAPNLPCLYAAQIFQAASFAIITPAMVQYVTVVIRPEDFAKGQSLSYGMTTLGSIFSGLFGGIMYDHLSVTATMLIGTAVCAVGATLCAGATENTGEKPC